MLSTQSRHVTNDARLSWPLPRDHAEPLLLRRAAEGDQLAITQLVHGERLNPHGLGWANFVVAVMGNTVVGAVQMRQHPDGSRELGSLVVSRAHRGRGIAGRLISALLARHAGTVHVITRHSNALHYRRWGFAVIDPCDAPRAMRRTGCWGKRPACWRCCKAAARGGWWFCGATDRYDRVKLRLIARAARPQDLNVRDGY